MHGLSLAISWKSAVFTEGCLVESNDLLDFSISVSRSELSHLPNGLD